MSDESEFKRPTRSKFDTAGPVPAVIILRCAELAKLPTASNTIGLETSATVEVTIEPGPGTKFPLSQNVTSVIGVDLSVRDLIRIARWLEDLGIKPTEPTP